VGLVVNQERIHQLLTMSLSSIEIKTLVKVLWMKEEWVFQVIHYILTY